ncbi:MAG: hypothetical protein ABF258_07965, partial [Flavobacteriales bacterium]
NLLKISELNKLPLFIFLLSKTRTKTNSQPFSIDINKNLFNEIITHLWSSFTNYDPSLQAL